MLSLASLKTIWWVIKVMVQIHTHPQPHVRILNWCLCSCLLHLCSSASNLVYRKLATSTNTWSISPHGWVITLRPNPQLWFRWWAEQQGHANTSYIVNVRVKTRLGGSPAELADSVLQTQRRRSTRLPAQAHATKQGCARSTCCEFKYTVFTVYSSCTVARSKIKWAKVTGDSI